MEGSYDDAKIEKKIHMDFGQNAKQAEKFM